MIITYGKIMSGGVCPCGGKLVYSKWQTTTETKETLRCEACGRRDSESNITQPVKKQQALF